jgi:prepilin-type N-terminal cleavage/methylation domain-containing protein
MRPTYLKQNWRWRGFTLIELLVVIAIIAILAATTLPMIPGVNDQARIGTCESRLQQIGIALRLYAEDHHRYPRSLQDLYKGRYLEQQSLLRCDKVGKEYYYRPVPLTADRDQIIAACCAPSVPSGQRPHRHGTVSVQLHVHGGATLAR